MAELLRDNLEAQRRGTPQEEESTSSSTPARLRREVLDIVIWVQCFGVYTAVVASEYPERTHKLWCTKPSWCGRRGGVVTGEG